MGEKIEDCEFWLPPKFLTDEDTFMEKKKMNAPPLSSSKLVCNAFEQPEFVFGSSFASDFSSPVESVVGSTESDEEDYLGSLTRQLTHSTLDNSFVKPNLQACVKIGLQKATLCGCNSCKGGSPTGPFQGRRPLPPPTWDLLYSAAGEVARMKNYEETVGFNHNKGLLGVHPFENPALDFSPHNQFQPNQFQLMKQLQLMKLQQQYQNIYSEMVVQNLNQIRARNIENARNRSNTAWLQRNGPGNLRAVFLDSPGPKREYVGTGVFIPRRAGCPADARRKPACSTALVPAKVVQALQRNFDEPGFNPGFISDSDSAVKIMRIKAMLQSQQQKSNIRPPLMNQEAMLPQEWTY